MDDQTLARIHDYLRNLDLDWLNAPERTRIGVLLQVEEVVRGEAPIGVAEYPIVGGSVLVLRYPDRWAHTVHFVDRWGNNTEDPDAGSGVPMNLSRWGMPFEEKRRNDLMDLYPRMDEGRSLLPSAVRMATAGAYVQWRQATLDSAVDLSEVAQVLVDVWWAHECAGLDPAAMAMLVGLADPSGSLGPHLAKMPGC